MTTLSIEDLYEWLSSQKQTAFTTLLFFRYNHHPRKGFMHFANLLCCHGCVLSVSCHMPPSWPFMLVHLKCFLALLSLSYYLTFFPIVGCNLYPYPTSESSLLFHKLFTLLAYSLSYSNLSVFVGKLSLLNCCSFMFDRWWVQGWIGLFVSGEAWEVWSANQMI